MATKVYIPDLVDKNSFCEVIRGGFTIELNKGIVSNKSIETLIEESRKRDKLFYALRLKTRFPGNRRCVKLIFIINGKLVGVLVDSNTYEKFGALGIKHIEASGTNVSSKSKIDITYCYKDGEFHRYAYPNYKFTAPKGTLTIESLRKLIERVLNNEDEEIDVTEKSPEQEIASTEKSYEQAAIDSTDRDVEQVEEEIVSTEQDIKQEDKEADNDNSAYSNNKNVENHSNETDKHEEKLVIAIDKLSESIEVLNNKLDKILDRLESLQSDNESINKKLDSLQNSNALTSKKLESLQSGNESINKKLDEQSDKVCTMSKLVHEHNNLLMGINNKTSEQVSDNIYSIIGKLQLEVMQKNQEIAQYKAELKKASSEDNSPVTFMKNLKAGNKYVESKDGKMLQYLVKVVLNTAGAESRRFIGIAKSTYDSSNGIICYVEDYEGMFTATVLRGYGTIALSDDIFGVLKSFYEINYEDRSKVYKDLSDESRFKLFVENCYKELKDTGR